MIRIFNHYLSVRTLLLTALEAAVLFQAVVMGFEIRLMQFGGTLPLAEAGIFTIVMLLMMTSLGLYEEKVEGLRVTIQRLLIAYVVTLMVMSAIFYLFPDLYVGRGVFAVTSLLSLGGIALVRVLFMHVTDIGLPNRRVLVVGNGPECEEVIRFLHSAAQSRSVKFAGMYPVIGERAAGGTENRVDHEQLLKTVRELGVSEIVIAVRERRGGVLPLRQLLDAKLHGVRVLDLTSFYERERGVLRVDNLHASWLIFGEGFDQGFARDAVKRTFDLLVSLALLAVTLPLLLVAMLAIMIETGRPVFYRQERVGQAGRPFTILKLRSMRVDAECDGNPRWAGTNDDRVTMVGRFIRKTRIDELPQLLNVLRGDMSFVGPRPERPFFVQQLLERIPFYDIRHSVKPGITGWSQVRYQYGASIEDALAKLQYDLYYVKNYSLFLDLLILVDTAQVVLLGKGAR